MSGGACDNCLGFMDWPNRCAGCGGEFCNSCVHSDNGGVSKCDVCWCDGPEEEPSDDE